MNDDTASPQPLPNEPPADEQPVEQAAPPPTRPDWQQRVHDEHAELQSKYQRLLAWLKEEAHVMSSYGSNGRDVQLLRDQAEAMQKYLTVLEARIANWL